MRGKLTLCATPIGNLDDMSPRAVEVLRRAGAIACEDTRRTRKLLTHLGIPTPELIVVNEQTERRRSARVVDDIARGKNVVLVSDAGMPGLSDPGYHLVVAAIERGIEIQVVPGPNAAVTALVLSGLPPGRFVFEGFLPRKSAERKRRLAELAPETRTLVFYESPHRIAACLEDMRVVLGSRRAALARELTKMYEEVRRGTLDELLASLDASPARGEIVVVLEGATAEQLEEPTAELLAAEARHLMDEGVPRKEAMAEVARRSKVSKKKVFDALLAEKEEG